MRVVHELANGRQKAHYWSMPRQLQRVMAVVALAHVFMMGVAGAAQPPVAPDDSQSEYLIDVWGTDEGLPSNIVTGIVQTPDGYLWCSTYGGVVRFDGVRFVRIGPDDKTNREAARVLCLHVDQQGQLWMGTDGAGVMRYAGGTFTTFAEPPGSPANSVRSIVEDTSGALWLGTQGGLGRLRDGKMTWFTEANGFSNTAKSIWNLALDQAGELWIADWNSLKMFRDGRFETVALNADASPPVRAVYAQGKDVWAGMLGRAMHRGRDGWKTVEQSNDFAKAEVAAFCQTQAGDFWVGTRKGLYLERDSGWTVFRARDGLLSSEVRALFEDREENLWVGTGTGGLARFKRRVLKTYTAQHGLTDGGVRALRERPDGGLWVGMNAGRLASGDHGTFQRFEGANLPTDAAVESVLETRDGALWVGTFGNGLVRFHDGQATQFRPSVGSPARIDKVTALLEDRAGTVWLGTYYSLYRATGSNVVVPVSIRGRDLRSPVTALHEDRAGRLWVACHGMGLVHLDVSSNAAQAQVVEWLTRRQGLPTDLVRTLHEDAAGTLWIGTEAGLCRWSRGGGMSVFTKAHGLADDTISQILEDDADNLWLGSNHGIMRVAKRELHAVADGRKTSLEVFACGRGEGMLSLECSGGFHPAGLKTRDGKLWFPTTRGLVMVDPSHLKLSMNPTPPPVHVERVRADGKLVAQPHLTAGSVQQSRVPLVLPASTHRVEFDYTALSFTAPERVRFKHRLDGFDADWTDAGAARSAAYNKLLPGEYRFHVIACNNDGVWNELGHSYVFRIDTPFWRTWWFLSLTGLMTAGTLGATVRFVSVRHLRRKLLRLEEAHAVEKERMRIAQDMHDEIGGKLSRISFLSDMASQNLGEKSEASEQIDQVSEAAREVIRTVDEIVWAVSPRNDTLDSAIHYICRHAEEFFELTAIELELKLPDQVPVHQLSAETRHNLFCAVKEALNNVLKHARATSVRIVFALHARSFEVTVIDNGRGFCTKEVVGRDAAPSASAGETNDDQRQFGGRRGAPTLPSCGDGLLNMRERLQSVGGSCTVLSEPGGGTRVAFKVPLKQV
jgi:ligand-binding sensor domain-containing protein/signal transduction histidine kinase